MKVAWMSTLDGIRACVFDAYGTLFDFSSPMQARREKIGADADKLNTLWRQKQLEYSWLRSLMGRHTDFWQITGEALDYAMAACDLTDPALRAELMQLYLTIEPYPESIETLRQLRAGKMQTAVLSNGSPTMLTAAVNHAEMTPLLNSVISVEEAGVYKPHPSVYQLVVDKFEVQPAEVLFLSANAWDVAGAAAFGFQVAWCNRTGLPPEKLPGEPVATVGSLAEVPGLVGL